MCGIFAWAQLNVYKIDGDTLVADGEYAGPSEGAFRNQTTCAAYSPDGAFLAIGDSVKEVFLMEVPERKLKIKGKWVFHSARIACLSWSPDSMYVASASLDQNIIVWNPRRAMRKTKIERVHKGGVTALQWASATDIMSAGVDGAIRAHQAVKLPE